LLLETHKMVPKLEQKGCDALLQLTLWSTWIELKCVKPSRRKLSPALLSKVSMLHMIFLDGFKWNSDIVCSHRVMCLLFYSTSNFFFFGTLMKIWISAAGLPRLFVMCELLVHVRQVCLC
jgi:hypothetical protein